MHSTTSQQDKAIRGFSLMEMTVTLAIVGIVMVMLTNVLLNSVVVAQRSIARSRIREEVADALQRISDDIRSASEIVDCQGIDAGARCEMIVDGQRYIWQLCNGALCKVDGAGQTIYRGSAYFIPRQLSFDQGFDISANNARRNLVITLVAEHSNPDFKVSNVVGQNTVSTRNYYLIGR